MKRERAEELLQQMAVQARMIIDQMASIAHEHQITSIPFLHGALQFGIVFQGSGRGTGSVSDLDGYKAATYPMMIDDYEWRPSHFECFPTDEQRRWMFGDNTADWPKTDYEE